MKIRNNVKPKLPPVPAGTYLAVCVYSIGIGEQLCKFKDATRYNNQVMIGFELIGQTIEVDGVLQPRQLGRTFNISANKNSGLRKFICSWLGKAMSDEEFLEFDTDSLLGMPAMISVVLNETGEYANIDSVMQLPNGMPIPTATGPILKFNMDDGWKQEDFDRLPEWAQEKIKKSTEYQKQFVPVTAVQIDPGNDDVLASSGGGAPF